MVNHVAETFKRQHGLDPRDDPNTAGRLWRECEDAKRTLSARNKANITCDYKGHAIRVELTREQFEELTHDLLDRTLFTTRQTLQAAGLTWSDIDYVLLVGGSTRMPMIGRALREVSGKEPDGSVAVDEAVAHGAALHAGVLLARHSGEAPRIKIKNVNSHSLGIVATDNLTGRKRNAVLIPRNTKLPVNAKRTFRTQKPGQKSILVQIVEGESANPDDCTKIGQCAARDLPANLPEQTPIEVKFHYAENGRLTVSVSVEGTSKELKHTITRDNTLNQEQLDAWRMFIAGA
jgi:molecular chaperone DnaK